MLGLIKKLFSPPENISLFDFGPYFDLSEAIKSERHIEKRIILCERCFKLLPKVVGAFLKEDGELPPLIYCRDLTPELYMRLGQWNNAERVIKTCIAANAYFPGNGTRELQYLESYKVTACIALRFLKTNPGFLQKDIYKALANDPIDSEELKHFIRVSLQIRKEKIGNTNRLFLT